MLTLSLPELCSLGNLEDVRRALASGEDVNSASQYGVTGLIWAVYRKQNPIVELLLSQPSLDLGDNSYGWTALHYASYHDNVEGLKMLLTHPSIIRDNVNGCVVFGGIRRSPLMLAILQNNILCIRELLSNSGVDLDTGCETLSAEVKTLIGEEKQRQENEQMRARLEREKGGKKDKEVEESLERRNQALRETEERMKIMMEDCTKTMKGFKDMMNECKKNYEEKEKREKAENAARFAELELSIEKIQKEKSDNSARFADLELSIEEMKKIQSKAAKRGKRKKWAILYMKCWKNKLAKL